MNDTNIQQSPGNIAFPVPVHLSPSAVHSESSSTLVVTPQYSAYGTDLEKNPFSTPPASMTNSLQLADVPQPSSALPKIESDIEKEVLAYDEKMKRRKTIWRSCIIIFWIMTLAGLIWAAAGGATLPSIVFLAISAVMAVLSCCLSVLIC
ncbi:hypothetical protein FRC03_010852 [Tulasnella sp. 419]|nr:hypothetical protein FRC03_010852 [Tulasnella sp. 419]